MGCREPRARNLRKGRLSQAGFSYFLTTTVEGRRPIFAEHCCALVVLDAIRWLHSKNRFCVDGAVVMPDHLHLIGQLGERSRLEAAPTGPAGASSRLEAAPTEQIGVSSQLEAAPTLATVMHSLKSFTASRLGRIGVPTPVWQPGYHDHALRDDEDYRSRVRYVVQNPLRAGLARRVEDYPYVILPNWERPTRSTSL